MSKRKKRNKCCCTPNCVYFPQDVSKEDIISIREKDGVIMREVRRHCQYDGALIKSWAHPCSRKIPAYINTPKSPEKAL